MNMIWKSDLNINRVIPKEEEIIEDRVGSRNLESQEGSSLGYQGNGSLSRLGKAWKRNDVWGC